MSGPGSAGMETCFVNLVEPGDKVIVCRNGVFGGRMKENVEALRRRAGAWWRTTGAGGRSATRSRTRSGPTRDARSSLSCTRKPPPARSPTPQALAEIAHSTARSRSWIASPRWAARRCMVDEWGIDADLFRQPEMPVLHAGPVAGQLSATRGRRVSGAQDAGAELVHGPQSGAWATGAATASAPTTIPRRSTHSMACTRRW